MMSSKTLRVLDDLLELSKKSDEFVRKCCADMAIDDSFFEEMKNKFRRIQDGDYSPSKSCSSEHNENDSFEFAVKTSIPLLPEYRSHVHVKNEYQIGKIQTGNSSNNSSLLSEDVKSDESIGNQVPFNLSDMNGNDAAQSKSSVSRCDSTIVLSSDSVVEVDPLCGPNPVDCIKSNDISRNVNGLESNISNSKNTPSEIKFQNVESIHLTPDMKLRNNLLGKTIVLKRNKSKKLSFINDKRLLNCNGAFQNKVLTRSNKINEIRANISLDIFHSASENLPNIAVSDKTHAISSTSNKENMDYNSTNKKCMIDVTNSPVRSGYMDQQSEATTCFKSGKRKKFHEVLSEIDALLNKENLTKTLEDSNEILFRTNKRKKSKECSVDSSSNVSSAVGIDVLKHKPKIEYGLRSLGNNSSNMKQSNDGLEVNESYKSPHTRSNYTNTRSEFERIKSALKLNAFPNFLTPKSNNKESYISLEYPRKRKLSRINKSSSDSTWESDNKESIITDSKVLYVGKKLVSTKSCRTILNGGKNRGKKSPSQFQTMSAPAHRKKTVSWKPRPSVESVADCNRQSLKVKAEEKRKQREIRVQRTKERRERLEKEREEKIRVSEQRLKQRFQQHEEILKQKTEKFKIKSRNRQLFKTKRNPSSTSSKDSSKEDTAKDNDDCCRNSGGSGQKLSKESNGYHDVSLKKLDPTSLEGNAGINPEISMEHNAILVGCEKTPVERAVSCNGNELKSVSLSQDARGMKESEESHSEYLEQYENASHQKNIQAAHLTSSCSKSGDVSHNPKQRQSDTPDEKRLEQNLTSPFGVNAETTKLKKLLYKKMFSNEMLDRYSPEKNSSRNNNPYFLRSTKKVYPHNATKNTTHASSITKTAEDDSVTKTNGNLPSCEMIAPSPVIDKSKWGNLGFKNKLHRPKVTIPDKKNTCKNDRVSVYTRNLKNSAKIFSKESRKENSQLTPTTETKKQKLTSYKISDFHNESFHESKVNTGNIPLWATGVYLKQALVCQLYRPLNPEEIFGKPSDPVDLVDMFMTDKPEYHKRTSSERWSITPT